MDIHPHECVCIGRYISDFASYLYISNKFNIYNLVFWINDFWDFVCCSSKTCFPQQVDPALHLSPGGVQLGPPAIDPAVPNVEKFSSHIPNSRKLHVIIINIHLKSQQLFWCHGGICIQQSLDNSHTKFPVERTVEEGVWQVFYRIWLTQSTDIDCCWEDSVLSFSGG